MLTLSSGAPCENCGELRFSGGRKTCSSVCGAANDAPLAGVLARDGEPLAVASGCRVWRLRGSRDAVDVNGLLEIDLLDAARRLSGLNGFSDGEVVGLCTLPALVAPSVIGEVAGRSASKSSQGDSVGGASCWNGANSTCDVSGF